MLNILRKYNNIAKRSATPTNMQKFSSMLKNACQEFNLIKNQINEEILKSFIIKDKLSGIYKIPDKDSLLLFLETVKKLESFKFGEYYFSKNDIFEFFINLKDFLNENESSKKLSSIFVLFEKLLLI